MVDYREEGVCLGFGEKVFDDDQAMKFGTGRRALRREIERMDRGAVGYDGLIEVSDAP